MKKRVVKKWLNYVKKHYPDNLDSNYMSAIRSVLHPIYGRCNIIMYLFGKEKWKYWFMLPYRNNK